MVSMLMRSWSAKPLGARDALGEPEVGQRAAARERELDLHEIEPEHLLGDRVLDLEPRVGLEEEEPDRRARRVELDQELDRPEALVRRGLGEPARRGDERAAQVPGQRTGWARPRSASGSGAAACTRDRTARPRACRRRRSGPRRGARAATGARRRDRRCRTPPALPSGNAHRRRRAGPRWSPARTPRPPPPAIALTMTAPPGPSARSASRASAGWSAAASPAASAPGAGREPARAALSPNSSSASGRGPRRSARRRRRHARTQRSR